MPERVPEECLKSASYVCTARDAVVRCGAFDGWAKDVCLNKCLLSTAEAVAYSA